ncbi:MAG: HAMP domain-containing protein [Bradymonadales bacterium]|nr:HAMP domain-containing protein [Bradymonadales bacterium]
MRLGVRTKLFLVSLIAIVLVEIPVGIFLESRLRRSQVEAIERELLRQAGAGRDLLELVEEASSVDQVDLLADRLGQTLSARVTVVAEDGALLGDSLLDPEAVRGAESHANRPEIVAALEQGWGSVRRYSATARKEMLYVAVRYQRSDSRGVVRISMPLDAVDKAVGQLRTILWAAGFIGLILAMAMSLLATQLVSRTLRRVVGVARSMAAGHRMQRAEVRGDDEIGGIASSLNRMAQELESTVATLAAERDRMEAVLEGMAEGVIVVDGRQQVVLINASARRLLSADDTAVGKPLADLVRAPALLELVRESARGQGQEAEFDLLGPPNRRILARATPQRLERGVVAVLHDVTRIRHLETVRRDFVANVSHELRTPVSVIQANAETLLNGAMADPDRASAFIEAIGRNSQRLSQLIADLLDLSRIEVGRYQLDIQPVPVEPVVQRVLDLLDKSARRKSCTLTMGVGEQQAARADPKAMEQVLMNLVDNAVKYTQQGGSIRIGWRRMDQELRFEVEDDGPGIEIHHRERIFERFYRVDPGRSKELGGTGLGLSIVKHLVELMGGQVGVEPVSPHGSLFWFTVPTDE